VTAFGFGVGCVGEFFLSPGKLQLKAYKSLQKHSFSQVRLLPFVRLSAYNKRRVEIMDVFNHTEQKKTQILSNTIEIIRPHKIRLHFRPMQFYLENISYWLHIFICLEHIDYWSRAFIY